MTRRALDVVVLGLGAMGSATLHHLARRGVRVLGLDRYAPPHTLGSSHGRTRIIREAYYEHPLYVPFVRRAYELWAELEAEWGAGPLLLRTGGLMIGPADGTLVRRARRAAEEHAIAHEMLDARDVARRFPAYAPPRDQVALLEHRAGILLPERCVEAHLALAQRHGAAVRTNVEVTGWVVRNGAVEVETTDGPVSAGRLVLAAGPWLPTLLAARGGTPFPLVVERQLSHWFAPRARPADFAPGACPIALWEQASGELFAAFPDLGDGVKFGAHHDGAFTDPDRVDRVVSDGEVAQARAMLAQLMPDAAGVSRENRVCLYTNTPDGHFILDRDPAAPEIVVASACSGHGFKFSSAVGELVADLATDRSPALDLSPFSARRFTTATTPART